MNKTRRLRTNDISLIIELRTKDVAEFNSSPAAHRIPHLETRVFLCFWSELISERNVTATAQRLKPFSGGRRQYYVSHCYYGDYFFFPVQTGPESHPASYPMGTGGLFLRGVKWPERKGNHSSPSSTEVKNMWSKSPFPKHVSMAWCLVKHRDNFTFTWPLNLFRVSSYSCLFNKSNNRRHRKWKDTNKYGGKEGTFVTCT